MNFRDHRHLRFLDRQGRAHDLNLKQGRFVRETAPASIQALAKDIMYGGRNLSYTGKSSLHKEIRRGNVEDSRRWAKVLVALIGETKVKGYLRGILFEETRNLALAGRWRSLRGLSAEQMAIALATSPKKWELSCRRGLFEQYLAACESAHSSTRSLDEVLKRLGRSHDLNELYHDVWSARLLRKEKEAYEQIRARSQSGQWLLTLAALPLYIHRHYAPVVLAEVLTENWKPEANTLAQTSVAVDEVLIVPAIQEWAYDNHTREGYRRLVDTLHLVFPGKPLPEGLDLRWSGMVRGVLWREQAYAQFSENYREARWEAVEIPVSSWRQACLADHFYYPRLIRSAKG